MAFGSGVFGSEWIMRSSFSDTSDVTAANKPVVETVVSTVARIEGVDPVDLSEPVFTFVDPDALDALVSSAPTGTDLSVTFEAWGHEITVAGDGRVRVDGEVRDRAPVESAARTVLQDHR